MAQRVVQQIGGPLRLTQVDEVLGLLMREHRMTVGADTDPGRRIIVIQRLFHRPQLTDSGARRATRGAVHGGGEPQRLPMVAEGVRLHAHAAQRQRLTPGVA